MSSTYSTNLAIELIGAGEQAGTWSTTTNTNLGTLIEQAISGYQTQAITDGADTVITIPNGATGVARNMVLELTGALTGARNLIVPANKKLYFIFNNTSGGQAVTVKVSGQTGVSVPNGAKVVLMSNGTDIVTATNYMAAATLPNATLSTPTMSAPTITGVSVAPTATFGTNTTQLATTAFVQAALQALYPVGAIYSSTVSTNPGTVFGFGTWVAYAAGRVMIGDGGGFAAGATGGSADAVVVSHTHTATTTITDPGHSHSANTYNSGTDSGPDETLHRNRGTYDPVGTTTSTTGITAATTVTSAGVSGTNANLQPYVVVYMWNRTA